jgi:hypothetical protein
MLPSFAGAICPISPIVLDLKGDGIDLGPGGVGVNFDLNADGKADFVQWMRPGGDDAFLAMDANGNGIVDDGSELFGNGTTMVLEGGKAVNGFVGLAQYDLPELGGNNDGVITSADGIWPKLRVWSDHDADGRSTSAEMATPDAMGLTGFGTIPKEKTYFDAAGNAFKFFSFAQTGERNVRRLMVDVFFVVLPSPRTSANE